MKEDETIQLRQLRIEDETTFRAAVAEFATFDGVDADVPFAFLVEKSDDFPAYVEMLAAWPEGKQLPDNYVRSTFLFAFEGSKIVGRASIRYELANEFLQRIGGNIGYAVIPSRHGRGYATEILRQALEHCAGIGLEKVLLTCDIDNTASQRVIEKNGGVFEELVDDPEERVPKRRYWIATAIPPS